MLDVVRFSGQSWTEEITTKFVISRATKDPILANTKRFILWDFPSPASSLTKHTGLKRLIVSITLDITLIINSFLNLVRLEVFVLDCCFCLLSPGLSYQVLRETGEWSESLVIGSSEITGNVVTLLQQVR